MYTFIMVVDSVQNAITAKCLAGKIGFAREEPNGRFVVDGPGGVSDGWIAISSFDSTGHDYDPDNYERLKQLMLINDIKRPSFFLVEGRDTITSLASDLLNVLDVNIKTLLDNDHGLIEKLEVFKGLAESGVDWLNRGGGIASS